MSTEKRDSSNPPKHYFKLNPRQQANWRRTTRRLERNEKLRTTYPPFETPSNTTVIHIHHRSSIETLEDLITRARTTRLYTIDTESQIINGIAKGALVQIEFIHSVHESTIILIESFHLPNRDSMLFKKIKELCSIILNGGNEIITWGPIEKEFKDFHPYGLFEIGKIKKEINLQNDFSDWHNTHPVRESRDEQTRLSNTLYETPGECDGPTQEAAMNIMCNCGHHSHYDQNATWSLQDAIASACQQFLDKTETINKWSCGLDLELNAWKIPLFSSNRYNAEEEKAKRISMKQYAMQDCTAVTKLYFIINPPNPIIENIYETPTANNIKMDTNDLSDISEDELIETLRPKFNQQNHLTINTTEEQMKEFNTNEQSQSIQQQEQEQTQETEPTTTKKSSKQEQQRRKNQKLKWKQRNRPDFQHKIKRPIYYRYDYRKIRSQLLDDDIHTSHQITIDQSRREVIIGFKNEQEQQRATTIMRINYFSREQFKKRWG